MWSFNIWIHSFPFLENSYPKSGEAGGFPLSIRPAHGAGRGRKQHTTSPGWDHLQATQRPEEKTACFEFLKNVFLWRPEIAGILAWFQTLPASNGIAKLQTAASGENGDKSDQISMGYKGESTHISSIWATAFQNQHSGWFFFAVNYLL